MTVFASFCLSVNVVVLSMSPPDPYRVDSPVGFQSASTRRGTMDIVYSCLTTMIICTVSAVHFDLPEDYSHRLPLWKKLRSGSFWKVSARKTFIILVGLVAPEFIVWWACGDYYEALRDYAFMKDKCDGWTLRHSFFAAMGGFKLTGVDAEPKTGRELFKSGAVLHCEQLGYEISDKSKADILTKSLAIVQIVRFLLQVIARAYSSHPISPFEFFACQHVFCAIVLYIFWFDKPRGVQEKILLEQGQPVEVDDKQLDLDGTYSA